MKAKTAAVCAALLLACAGLMAVEHFRLGEWGDEGEYLFSAACALVLGLLSGLSFRKLYARKWGFAMLVPAVTAVCALLSSSIGFLREMLTALWIPAVVWLAFAMTGRMSDWKKRPAHWLYAMYFVLVLAAMAALQYRSRLWLSFEPVQTGLMLLCADAALLCYSPERGCTHRITAIQMPSGDSRLKRMFRSVVSDVINRMAKMRRARLISLLCANAAVLALSLRQDRVYDIVFGRVGIVGWLRFRWETLAANFSGRLDLLSEWTQSMVGYKCPISGLAHEFGLLQAIIAAVLTCASVGLCIMLLKCIPRSHVFYPACKALAVCLAISAAVGLLCDLLLIVSTSAKPFLMRKPWELCVVVMMLCLIPEAAPIKEEKEISCMALK